MNTQDRFWSYVVKSDGCWAWTGGLRHGYGAFYDGERTIGAHRYSWELHNGPIGEGLLVCHKCDNHGCTNPDHLFIGTYGDNMQDCVTKGRFAKGERNGVAKMTREQVLLAKTSPLTARELAPILGVSRYCINDIRSGRCWLDIQPETPVPPRNRRGKFIQ